MKIKSSAARGSKVKKKMRPCTIKVFSCAGEILIDHFYAGTFERD